MSLVSSLIWTCFIALFYYFYIALPEPYPIYISVQLYIIIVYEHPV